MTAAAVVGHLLGPSPWLTVDQQMVDTHARNTGDDDWIHTDPVRAAAGPTGGTIVQGFLLLALLQRLHEGTLTWFEEHADHMLNYGFDRIRFVRPVLTGSRVSASSRVTSVEDRGDGAFLVRLAVTLEVDDRDVTPAMVADWLFLVRTRAAARSG